VETRETPETTDSERKHNKLPPGFRVGIRQFPHSIRDQRFTLQFTARNIFECVIFYLSSKRRLTYYYCYVRTARRENTMVHQYTRYIRIYIYIYLPSFPKTKLDFDCVTIRSVTARIFVCLNDHRRVDSVYLYLYLYLDVNIKRGNFALTPIIRITISTHKTEYF